MKRTDSTEMDRLLRRHFRRNGETLSDKGASAQESKGTSHMDADEMNAYAEGALPGAARSRYFAHLADCDDCRKLVTDLTLAYGAVSEERRAAAQEPSPSKSWREWLAALLSPPVMRYGVASLALLAVIIVAIVALRARREEPSYMAQNKEAARNSALSTSSAANSSAESSTPTTAENHASADASSSNSAPATAQQPQPEINPAATPTPPAKATVEEKSPAAPTSVAAKTEAQSGGVLDTKQEDRPREDARSNNTLAGTAAAPPPASPAAKPGPADADNMAKRDEEQRKQKATTKDQNETVVVTNSGGAVATTQTTSAEAPRERGRAAARAPQSLPMDKAAANSRAGGGAAEKESSSETRTVGGRSFRRQGGAWVDTSYNSSRTTINIARGSEQYRALLADEPGLRTITKQLGGEVIVVWGSKAYRFY